jgi:putative protease
MAPSAPTTATVPGDRARPEILAPGGDADAVRAAILAGADAVYLGLARFNARMRAQNLDLAALRALSRLARSYGVRTYVTLNTIVTEAELPAAAALGRAALEAGADALILQDLGLLGWLREHLPAAELHASTQLTTHNQAQLEVLARAGVTQVNLSRELELDEVRTLAARAHALGLRVEVFVHGAYCVSFSGQCYLSALTTGLSGNCGECVQPCRRRFTCGGGAPGPDLARGARGRLPPYPLNLKDNNALAEAAALIEAGVDAFKIEGRRKGFYYVHTVVTAWRARLDALGRGEPAAGDDPALGRVFNRGFSTAYLRGAIDRDAFALDGNDRSLERLGTVAAYTADTRTLRCAGAPRLLPGVRVGVYTREMDYVAQFVVEARAAPDRFRVRLEHALKGRIERGQQLFALAEQREADALLVQARALEVRRRPLTVVVEGSTDRPLVVRCADGGTSVTVASRVALQRATRNALGREQLGLHLGKLGETDYTLGALDLDGLEPGLFLPVSELNRLRQAAVEQLGTARGARPGGVARVAPVPPLAAPAARPPVAPPPAAPVAPRLRQPLLFVAGDLEEAVALRDVAGDDALVAVELQGPRDTLTAAGSDAARWLVPWFPAVVFDADLPTCAATLASRPWRLVVSDNAGVGAQAAAAGVPWLAGGLLNTANARALQTLRSVHGACGAVLSPELDVENARELGLAAAGLGLLRLATIFGPQLGLQTRQCLVRDLKACRLPRIEPTCVPECRVMAPVSLEPAQALHLVKRPGFHSQLWDARLLCYPEAIGALAGAVDAFVVDLRDPGFVGRTRAQTLHVARWFTGAVAAGRAAPVAIAGLRRLVGACTPGLLGRSDREPARGAPRRPARRRHAGPPPRPERPRRPGRRTP